MGGWRTLPDGTREWDALAGSGTIVQADDDGATILTCAHIFRIHRFAGQAPKDFPAEIAVDTFDGRPNGWPQEMRVLSRHPAVMLAYDFATDLSIIRIKTGQRLRAATLQLDDKKLAIDQRVRVAGCPGAKLASVFDGEVLSPLQRGIWGNPEYLSVVCRIAPMPGRSGGGLFNQDEELIGVAGYRSEVEDIGYYAHPIAIKAFLQRNNATP